MSDGLHILEDENAPGDMDAQVRVFFDKHEVWLYQGQRDEDGRWDQICMTEAQAKALGQLLREGND